MIMKRVNFNTLIGKVILKIEGNENSDSLKFICQDGSEYVMQHMQDCCESVSIEDIDGNLSRLLGLPITIAEESSSSDNVGEYGYTCTWTFYKLGNVIDTVTIRWYGESNGYYSEDADLYETQAPTTTEVHMDIEKKIKETVKEIEALKVQVAEKNSQISQKQVEVSILKEAFETSRNTEEATAKKIVARVAKFWDEVYEKPDWLEVKFVKVVGEDEKAIDINISRQYHHPKLTFAVLKKMSELFETDRIDTYDEWSQRGCDTCDYGSSYGYTIRILPNEKGGKFTFKLD